MFAHSNRHAVVCRQRDVVLSLPKDARRSIRERHEQSPFGKLRATSRFSWRRGASIAARKRRSSFDPAQDDVAR
jgi:hypothetical protein